MSHFCVFCFLFFYNPESCRMLGFFFLLNLALYSDDVNVLNSNWMAGFVKATIIVRECGCLGILG